MRGICGFADNKETSWLNHSHIEKTDANTRTVFGDYISIYDMQRAVADKATVPIYYESRIDGTTP